MSKLPWMMRNPDDDQGIQMAPPQPRVQMAAPVNPFHAHTAPIISDPKDVLQLLSKQQPTVEQDPNPTHQIEGHEQNRLMADYQKDANPYGSPTNHPGFFGKLLHGLSYATGGPNRRQMEEQGIEKHLQDIGKTESEEGLQGAQAENQESEVPLHAAQTREADARANAPAKETALQHFATDDGFYSFNPATGEVKPLQYNGQNVAPPPKETPEKGLIQSQPVIGPDGKPHTYLLDPMTGEKKGDEGIHYERPISITNNPERKEKGEILKLYQPSLDSAERFNVMAKNYEDAIKNHDQQAMLSLLANHLGMTMGLQKGSRLTRDIIREAEQSRPWLQGMQAKFDKDGYLSGVNLTPAQMRQMVDLGRGRFAEDTVKARNEGKYLGATDDGPTRTPSKATINHYLALANGDAAKAKQLAAEDGWSVK